MKAIFASKLYRSSTRKNKINAALKDPINTELVQQLAEYLDDYEPEKEKPKLDTHLPDTTDKSDVEDTPDIHNNSVPSIPHNPNRSIYHRDDPNADLDSDLDDKIDENDINSDDDNVDSVNDEPNADESDDDSLDSSTRLNPDASRVTSATTLYKFAQEFPVFDPVESIDIIKGTLNSREDTCGVTRITVKENEIWIYYNDKINLNNVMSQVIDLITGAYSTQLEFNRLARSENAVVFEIICSTNSEVNSEENDVE